MSAIATIDLGKIKFKWRGAYNAATAYSVDDVVSHQGSSFVCTSASTGNAPLVGSTYWELMALGGNPSDILTTKGDLLVRGTAGLERLPLGAAGKVLAVGQNGMPIWKDEANYTMVQRQHQLYNSGAWTPTESYNEVAGLNINFTPKYADSVITYRANYNITKYDNSGFITHLKFMVGSNWYYYLANSNHTAGYGEHRFPFEINFPSWGTDQRRMGLHARSYSSSYRGYFHATGWWDGSGQYVNAIPANVTIEEWKLTSSL